jgi:hypothetical protein
LFELKRTSFAPTRLPVLQEYAIGSKVEVTYYRGNGKGVASVTMGDSAT